MTDWIKTYKLYFIIGGIILVALTVHYFMPVEKEVIPETENEWQDASAKPSTELENTADSQNESKGKWMVDVKGAVVNPGVYEAEEGDRVVDIIQAAGGLLENADKNQINFAMKVTDEMVLYFPVAGESETGDSSFSAEAVLTGGASDSEKVNINIATEEDLQTLTGIGPSKAAAIIEYREKNGQFKETEQLMEISGIGEKTFEKLKEQITVK
nr:helix-hairpin-helix domain-containing protein [uncultured Bacillus sp.]